MIALIIICVVSFINKASCVEETFFRQTDKHGTLFPTSVNSFTCPGNGAITGIQYFVDNFVMSLEFNCSSSDGIRAYGPYGIQKGTSGNFTCPPGQYISSFHGNSGRFISRFGVRCREINIDLTGDGEDFGKLASGTDTTNQLAFDDLAYTAGARIVSVTIWNSFEVEAIQFVYSNIPVELCTTNCKNYKEEFGAQHGVSFIKGKKLTLFTCPDNSQCTGVKVKISNKKVVSLQFLCNSEVNGTSPVFGAKMDSGTTLLRCPPGMIIGSFLTTGSIIGIGIRCVDFGDTSDSLYFDVKGDTSDTVRDDVKYLDRGWRPVLFRVTSDNDTIDGFQVKYGNSNITTNCKVTRIEVVDQTVVATPGGSQVVGVVTGTSCGTNPELLLLEYSDELTDSLSFDAASGGETNWDNIVQVDGTLGSYVSQSAGFAKSTGGSRHYSTGKSNTVSTSTKYSAGTEITYYAPGACAIVGYVESYKISGDNIAVKYHYRCQIGKMLPRLGTIKVSSTTYGNVFFESLQFNYTNTASCTDASRNCVKLIEANNVTLSPTSFAEKFLNCSRL